MVDGADEKFSAADRRFDTVDAKLAAHDQRFDMLDAKLAAHDRQFELIARTFEEVFRRFDTLETRLETRFNEIFGHFNEIYRRLDRLEQESLMIVEGMRRIEAAFLDEQGRREMLERRLAGLKTDVVALQARIDALEQRLHP